MKKCHSRKLDLLWAKKVREKGHCESFKESGQYVRLEAAHIIGRTYRTTRGGCWIDGKYDLAGMCLCVDCHQHYDQHRQKHDFIVRGVIGQERYEKLIETKQVIAKYQDPEEIKKWLDVL